MDRGLTPTQNKLLNDVKNSKKDVIKTHLRNMIVLPDFVGRHIAIYLARELTRSSFPAIGKAFGDRDHSTAMHSYMRIKSLLGDTPLLYSEIREIEDNLRSRYTLPAE